ncbi:MAG: hypothetical protein ACRD0F_01300 [Acidimicrobiales bacterium]
MANGEGARVDDAHCAEAGWLLVASGLQSMEGSGAGRALESFSQAAKLGDRFGDVEGHDGARSALWFAAGSAAGSLRAE